MTHLLVDSDVKFLQIYRERKKYSIKIVYLCTWSYFNIYLRPTHILASPLGKKRWSFGTMTHLLIANDEEEEKIYTNQKAIICQRCVVPEIVKKELLATLPNCLGSNLKKFDLLKHSIKINTGPSQDIHRIDLYDLH